jgi:2-keto-3-deoxy-L-rhamnonate aldolase RhmA
MAENVTFNLKKRLEANDTILGTLVGWGNRPEATVTALKQQGWDFFLIDLEHSLIDKETVIEYVRAAKEVDLPVLLRPEENSAPFRCYLDAGVSGLILPQVETVEQATYAVNQTFFPPIGHRGCGIGASPFLLDSHDLSKVTALKITEYINNNTMLFPLTESLRGISNLHHILNLKGVTGTIVGAYDLAFDIGVIDPQTTLPGILHNKTVYEKLAQVAGICKEAGKVAGLGGFPPRESARWAKLGFQVFTFGYVFDGNVSRVKPLIEEAKALIR